MKIKNLLEKKKLSISFEIFPPKNRDNINGIYNTISKLSVQNPDFISVTYGSLGSPLGITSEIASIVENKHNVTSLAHLTCIQSSKKDLDTILENLKKNNIENILALRGDVPEGENKNIHNDFSYAYELVRYLKENYDFSVGAACYPEGHTEAKNKNQDIKHLKSKISYGVDFLISQLFFDNNVFYNFLDKLNLIDINTPIIAGIMPLTNKAQILKITNICGAKLPDKLKNILDKYEHNKEALEDAGIVYASEQIIDLITSEKVNGIHIYTMNKPEIAERILGNIKSIRTHANI